MEITEVRIKLMEEAGERLQAFCSITFDDCFVIRDLKIIEGTSGPFVAMPSRKLTAHCSQCGCKNHLRAGYCNQCGSRLKDDRASKDEEGRAKLYADIAHPINSACREMIQDHVIKVFFEELERSRLPGYVSSYDDFDEDTGPAHREHGPREHHKREERKEAVTSGGSPIEPARIQPAVTEPRPPHRAPQRHSTPQHSTPTHNSAPPQAVAAPHSPPPVAKPAETPKRGNFGAGIL